MNGKGSTVAIYPPDAAAEVVKELLESGYDLRRLSIAGRDTRINGEVVGYYNIGKRIKMLGNSGPFWSGLWGLLVRSGIFWIPDMGPILVAGPLVGSIVGALEGATAMDGVSPIGAGLCSLGIPRASILSCEAALAAGRYVFVAHGNMADTFFAMEIFRETGPEALELHM